MPEIARFYGITIEMRWREHGVAHIHARYAGFQAVIGISPLSVLNGRLPPRALSLVLEWAALHQKELEEDWQLAIRRKPLNKIQPLT